MPLPLQDLVSLGLLSVGFIIAASGLLVSLRHGAHISRQPPPSVGLVRPSAGAWFAAVAIALLSVALGMEGIERRGITHEEVWNPGIDLPERISVPPPRLGLAETVRYHFHREPHPPAYYLMMWGWAKLAGTSLIALRLPSVLFGGAAVLLLFAATAAVYGSGTGLMAATLLAINGHHVYWTQYARMYEMSLFLSIASLLFLIKLLRGRATLPLQFGYVAVTALGLYTQQYFWLLLAGQMAFVFFAARDRDEALPHAFYLQSLVVILGSPMWAHAIYGAHKHPPQEFTSVAFAQDYINFGFLSPTPGTAGDGFGPFFGFSPDTWSAVPRDISFPLELLAEKAATGRTGSQKRIVGRRCWSPPRFRRHE